MSKTLSNWILKGTAGLAVSLFCLSSMTQTSNFPGRLFVLCDKAGKPKTLILFAGQEGKYTIEIPETCKGLPEPDLSPMKPKEQPKQNVNPRSGSMV